MYDIKQTCQKSGSFTLVLTVISLSVLMSLEADAQSTTDETKSCSSSSLQEVVNLVERIASVQQVYAEKMENFVKLIASNTEKIASSHEKIASMLQENTNEVKSVKELLASNSSVLAEISNVVKRIAGIRQENNKVDSWKQQSVSALISQYLELYFSQTSQLYLFSVINSSHCEHVT